MYISKRAGRIDVPNKMSWVIFNYVYSKLVGATEDTAEFAVVFPIDVSDTKQYQQNEWFRTSLKHVQDQGFYTKLKVYTKEEPGDAATYSDHDFQPEITLRRFFELSFNTTDHDFKRALRTTIDHELVHMMQFMMSEGLITLLRMDESSFAGVPGKYDRFDLIKYDPHSATSSKQRSKAHSLSDIEFFTNLQNSIDGMVNFVFGKHPNAGITGLNLLNVSFKIYLKRDETLRFIQEELKERMEDFAPEDRAFQKLDVEGKKRYQANPTYWNYYLMLKRDLDKAKLRYDKYVRELHRAFEEELVARDIKTAEDVQDVLLKLAGKYDRIDFKPPQSVADAAARGLEWRKKNKGKGGLNSQQASKEGIGSGVQRAVNLKNRNTLSPATVRRMKAFFDRHVKSKEIDPGKTPQTDKGYIAWLLWGGDPGYSWARKIVRQMDAMDKKASETRPISKRAAIRMAAWWLSPEGKLYEAPGGHEQFIKAHPEWFIYTRDNPYLSAYARGWIRISNFESSVLDVVFSPSKYGEAEAGHVFNMLKAVYPQLPKVGVDIPTFDVFCTDKEFEEANTIEDLNPSFRKPDLTKEAAMEQALGIGVSVRVRKYWREYYAKKNMPNMALMRNEQLNQVIAGDFQKAKPIHRVLLKSAEPGEFRKSGAFYYLAAYRNGRYDIIAITPAIKEPGPDISKLRMNKDWLDKGWLRLLDKKTRPGT